MLKYMTELTFFHYLLIGWFALAGAIFIALFFVVAPYGRHTKRNWGPGLNSKMGWIVMESTAPLMFGACFVFGQNRNTIAGLVFLILWEAHYIHRAFIYPFRRKESPKPMPMAVIALGFIFNAVNGYLNGRYIYTLSDGFSNSWLADPRFITGVLLFIGGFIINRESDHILHNLRQVGESGYKITHRGLFHWISCPNYLGEIMIWTGWALSTWSITGLSFAVWTAANLIPRARSHHIWYQKNFADYPANRKTLVPGIW